ncbi:MAG: hypothetical protein OXG53_06420 [Chloroflexi bacterium]|nr:hypothetical protein [Chloroflexota bacterium]
MRFLLSTFFLVAFAFQVVSAQEPAAEYVSRSLSGWRAVLDAGALDDRPDIVAVDDGFALAVDSLQYPWLRPESAWLFLDPASGEWSQYEFPPVESPLLDLDDNAVARLDIAGLFPDEPGLKFQLVDGGEKVVTLFHAGEMLFDHQRYDGVVIVNPAKKTVQRLNVWLCYGPPRSGLIVWDFPEQDLSVSCDFLIWHEGDSSRLQPMHEFIGMETEAALILISHSPDNRYWVLRNFPHYNHGASGDYYVYDRQTGLTTVLLWSLMYKPQRELVIWLDDSSLLVNAYSYILYVDLETGQRHELLNDEIMAQPYDYYIQTWLSLDGQWLLIAPADGSLLLRNVFDALGR